MDVIVEVEWYFMGTMVYLWHLINWVIFLNYYKVPTSKAH